MNEICHQVAARAVRCSFLLSVLALVVCSSTGCSSFRKRRQQPASLTTARQFSLRGADALQQQKYDDAETLFSESLRHCPTDERAHWGLAEVLYQRGDKQDAAVHMQEAAKVSGNNPDLLVRLGEMQLEAGESEMALQQAELALAADWQHASAWQLKGHVLERMAKNEQAMEAYHRALMSQPNNPQVQIALASLYQRSGRPQRALATIERMSDLQNPEYNGPSTWMLKGAALASLGQMEESRLCLREAAMRAGPGDSQLHLQIAQLQSDIGDLADARANLGRALSQDPSSPAAIQLQQNLEQRFRELPSGSTGLATTRRTDFIPASVPIRSIPNSFSTPYSATSAVQPPAN